MYRIMFVCMGNVCRSPLAQVLMDRYLEENSLKDMIETESSGVNVYSEGQRACETIRQVAEENGVPFDHYSRRFTEEDFEKYGLILAMDHPTMDRLKSAAAGKTIKGRIGYFRDYDPGKDGSREVPDPWYGGKDQGREVYEIIDRTVKAIAESVTDSVKK